MLRLCKAEANNERKMIAVAWLVAHTVVGAARTHAAVACFVFKQKLRSMDEGLFHLII